MKTSEVRSSLLNLAEKLDSQWAYASQLARRQEIEGLLCMMMKGSHSLMLRRSRIAG